MKKLAVYLAGPWVDRLDVACIAKVIEAEGHEITRDWWNHEAGDEEHEKLREQALADWDAVCAAEVLVVYQSSKSEGKAVETGIALQMHMPVIVIGPISNIFHHLPQVTVAHDVQAALCVLRGMKSIYDLL